MTIKSIPKIGLVLIAIAISIAVFILLIYGMFTLGMTVFGEYGDIGLLLYIAIVAISLAAILVITW